MKWNTTALKEFHPTSIYLFVAYFLYILSNSQQGSGHLPGGTEESHERPQ
jgi:hypothetical protein